MDLPQCDLGPGRQQRELMRNHRIDAVQTVMTSWALITIGPGPLSWPQTAGGGDAVFEHPGRIAYLLSVDGPQELNPAPPLPAIRSLFGHGVEAS